MEKGTSQPAGKFPVVAIGASAGGLEALEQFLGNLSDHSGMAYVVIQHLDPTHKGMLPELLQRVSKMKVFQVKDRMPVKPDCVYVIPPNTSMSILKGVLHLFQPIESRGLRLPIDFFLRSLADDLQEFGIAVILSGMGSDGSLGVRAVKEKNGTIMIQEPATAKYDSMPRNAIDAVLPDIIAPPSEMPARLLDFLNHIPIVKLNLETEIKDQSSLEKIIILLRTYTGNDFSLYKKNTLYRRIERRMSVHKIEKIVSYVLFLHENPKEADILFKELLIGVTNFFRDSLVWNKIEDMVIPQILTTQQSGSVLRAWVAGCSTGEEAYSLAIVFKEAIEKIKPQSRISLQIFATDLDAEAIEIARKGFFPLNIASDVSENRLNRFFIRTDDGYRVKTEIREMVIFAQHNIIMHPPFTKLDILTCRNLLIYMVPELQNKLFGLFYYSLNPEGIMLLGSAETPGAQSHLFTPVDAKLKIFKRSVSTRLTELTDFPSSFSRATISNAVKPMPDKSILNIQTLADQLMLQRFSPAGVLVNENGDIIYFSGHTGKYLEPAVGKANLNIFAMLREGLRNEFSIAFRKAIMNKETVLMHNLKLIAHDDIKHLDINIQWIDKPEPLHGLLMILFTDLPEITWVKPPATKAVKPAHRIRQSDLEEELQHAREERQNTMEEMQTSQEELKSTNEELQSTNEELQSTNEELTTSKEEMQSLNEELQTVNAELQSKVDDYSRVNNDMKNLLNSTDIATLFLDKDLNIRRFTNQATKIFKLIKSDIGRPFTDLVSDLRYPELAADALEVLRTLVFIEKQIPTNDGRWFTIRIMPYRTFDDRIDGLVITFINHSNLRQMEIKLHETSQINGLLMNSSREVIIQLSPSYEIMEFNPEAELFFGKKREEALNKTYIHLFVPLQSHKKIQKDLDKLSDIGLEGSVRMPVIAAGGKIKTLDCDVNIFRNNQKKATGIMIIQKKLNHE
jgi:two-component system CheB/CheR fusion protein